MDVSTNFDVDCRYSDNPRDFCSRRKDRQRGLITNGQYQDPRSSPGLEKRERKSCLNRRNRNICVWGKYGSAFCSGTLHVHVLGVL